MHSRRHILFAIIGVAALNLAVLAGEIFEHHRKLPATKPASYQHATVTNHGIIEIGIERLACYGKCPVYTLEEIERLKQTTP